MADLDVFERRVAKGFLRLADDVAGTVDAAAVAHRVALEHPRRRTGALAWRRVALPRVAWVLLLVAALVALVAGTLIVGSRLLESAPRFPAPLYPPVAGMVVEEVEPGVLRVLNDGVRDLSFADRGYPSFRVDVTPDGAVWLSGDEGRQGLFRLGQEPVFEDVQSWPPYMAVAPDGMLWAISEPWGPTTQRIFSFDGAGWTERATMTDASLSFQSLAIGPDGTAWVAASDQDRYCSDTERDECPGTVLMRLEDDGSLTTIEDWGNVYHGPVSADELAVSPTGDVWLVGMTGWEGLPEALLRFDGKAWELIPGPEGLVIHLGQSLGFGPDGTLWVNTSGPDSGGLARFDGSGWTVLTEADGVAPWGAQGFISVDLLTVAPDGSLWMNGRPTPGGCGGVAHYDGTTWDSYVVDACIHDLAVAPDGGVWLRAVVGGSWEVPGTVYTYVITAEAVEAAE